mgnify:CR=1 FL=1
MKLKIIIASAISLTLVVSSILYTRKTEAQAFLPIGGPILYTFACCNGMMLTLGTPTPGTYLYTWGTPLYPLYNIMTPGPYVLGRGVAGGACLLPYTYCATAIPTTGTFVFLGTSGL